MSGLPVGHTAIGLAWLPPPALLALTAEPPGAAALLRDPAAVALVLRYARPTPDLNGPVFTPQVLTQPGLCEAAASLFDAFPPRNPVTVPESVTRVTDVAAEVAAELARCEGAVAPDLAAGVARLAALGWFAVSAVGPDASVACIEDPVHADAPESVQRRHWGLDASSIARRLAARWRLPPPVVAVIGSLKLTAEDAQGLGAPAGLFRVVQAATHAAESAVACLGLTDPRFTVPDVARAAQDIASRVRDVVVPPPAPLVISDHDLVVRLLRATAQARRSSGAVWLADAEATIDRMTDALAGWRATFDERLLAAKLEGLAEFAAGASHEINNPLAVISGHAQLLLAREADPDRQRQLAAIVRQTKRVHDLLQGTLQFARPPRPEPVPLTVASVVAEVAASFKPDAEAKGVALHVAGDATDCDTAVTGDRGQLRQVIGHVVRNAIDAAPDGGWVRITTEIGDKGVRLSVEDSGPGPATKHVPHLFDPFFSGRAAGRGRGLGLSIAWQLARVNGADLRYHPAPDGTTRFVLTLPYDTRDCLSRPPERKSA